MESNYHNLYIPKMSWDKLEEIRKRLEENSPSSTVRRLVDEEIKRKQNKEK